MVKNVKKNKKSYANAEIHTLILLLSAYLLGVCIGCFYVYSNKSNAIFSLNVINSYAAKNILYFVAALILKYSGILSGIICILPVFIGIQNSIYYCSYILNSTDKIIYTTILTVIKDSALTFLLILYIIVIVSQILNQKYVLKKDLKYFAVYFSGANIIILLEYLLKTFIF